MPSGSRPRNLRISVSSVESLNGEFSAGPETPSSTTSFSLSPTTSTHSYPSSSFQDQIGDIKDEPFTPSFSSDQFSLSGESADVSKEEEETPVSFIGPIKRKRGRPKKIVDPTKPLTDSKTKVTKGRSKTGCLTCRRRKKKCDEAKPECDNCHKNGYICEGYPQPVYWRSGKDHIHRIPPFKPSLPALIEGVESDTDRRLLNHFMVTVSPILTKFNDEKNPFKDILLPLAIDNSGLMHSLLCLAGSHLARTDPSVEAAQYHHKEEAIKLLSKGLDNFKLQEASMIDDYIVASAITLCLNAICSGDARGEHRIHMAPMYQWVQERANQTNADPRKVEFAQFFLEFFRYHVILDGMTSMEKRPNLDYDHNAMAPFFQPEAGSFIGILDQLFVNISGITTLRRLIRERKREEIMPTIDVEMLAQAVEIDNGIKKWQPPQSPHQQHRHMTALLYQQVTWLYLYRTINRSVPDPKIRIAVDEGLKCFAQLAQLSNVEVSYSVLLMPVFLLGCAAFDTTQRPEITKIFGNMKTAGLQNAAHAQTVVHRIWELMDEEDETSWDWEKIIFDLGYDFVLT